jgi:hypothetical protein
MDLIQRGVTLASHEMSGMKMKRGPRWRKENQHDINRWQSTSISGKRCLATLAIGTPASRRSTAAFVVMTVSAKTPVVSMA